MYEKPALNRVGDAQDVILGIALIGGDVDLTYCPPDPGGLEFEPL